MKLMNLAVFSFLALAIAANVEAQEVAVQCKRIEGLGCAVRTNLAFEKLGCRPLAATVDCRDAASDPMIDPSEIENVRGKDFCSVQSDCREPRYGNFGQVSCEGTTIDLKNVDRGITLTTSVGLFRHYVTTLCK